MSSRLVLHIGFPRTGSTAIQTYLNKTRGLYASEHGVRLSGRWNVQLRDYALGEGSELEILSAAQGRPGTFVVSHEAISVKARPEAVQALKAALEPHFSDIKFVCYVRRQDEVLISSYGLQVMFGATRPIEDFFDFRDPAYTYHERLRVISNVFGDDRIIVRRYGRPYFRNGDLIDDFCDAAGIPALPQGRQQANATYSAEALEFFRQVNLRAPAPVKKRSIVKYFNGVQVPDPGRRLGLEQAVRGKIIARYADENRACAQRYLGDEALFSHDVPDDPVPPVKWTPEKVADVTTRLMRLEGGEELPFPRCASTDEAMQIAIAMLTWRWAHQNQVLAAFASQP